MIKAIRQEFIQILKDNKWMDEKSSKLALDKANYIESNVGYPEYIYNDTYMNTLYENVGIRLRLPLRLFNYIDFIFKSILSMKMITLRILFL